MTAVPPPSGSSPASGGGPGERPPHRPRHRWLTLLIVVLLIAVPAGYIVKSGFDSRESGKDKERGASATGLIYDMPSKVLRRIYTVPVPPNASRVAYYETNSWQTSSLYVQFRTSDKRLAEFLTEVGTDVSALKKGEVTITTRQADEVGWKLREQGHTYAGTVERRPKSEPDLAITVDTTYEGRPRVHVVSTTEF
ncbi:hypothetical protein E0L36_14920 [Streptomyces sp. AJS327]|uniref:hypothetical protein n=1 Tax=Streptomyces sp. AJS327 TaxID=2545265 RepID=UPI0015DD54FF|nr:hypothetical protein [Streptomyces sp. AJS327]MBA0052144.1 hypothetical protein [Streptomyces sp. AJS327]